MKNTFIGTPMERREDLRFLRGRGTYVDDLKVPGLLYAVILRSSVAHGRLKSVDASAALKLAGVRAVITAADIPGTNDVAPILSGEPILAEGDRVLASRVRFRMRRMLDRLAREKAFGAGLPERVAPRSEEHTV